jgi:menaquinone-dependent protoporphyrinogen oxidase
VRGGDGDVESSALRRVARARLMRRELEETHPVIMSEIVFAEVAGAEMLSWTADLGLVTHARPELCDSVLRRYEEDIDAVRSLDDVDMRVWDAERTGRDDPCSRRCNRMLDGLLARARRQQSRAEHSERQQCGQATRHERAVCNRCAHEKQGVRTRAAPARPRERCAAAHRYADCVGLFGMKPFVVLYATREGHTRRIAEHVHARLVARGHEAEVHDVGTLPETFDVHRYRGAIIAASVHGGEHEAEMVEFVKRHRAALERVSAAFLSVSLSEASVEQLPRDQAYRKKAEQEVHEKIASFLDATEWRPRRVEPVAGALMYSQRGPVSRFVTMLRAKRGGTSTDTSRDHEYTDWEALERFVEEFVEQSGASSAPPPPASEKEIEFLG